MKIAGNCSWKPAGETVSVKIGDEQVEICYNDPNYPGDYAIDLEPPFSEISAKYDPKQRIYATTEPELHELTSRHEVALMDEYYKGLILTWHSRLKDLPQTRVFRPAAKWVGPMNDNKEFGFAGLVSDKNKPGFAGYAMRHAILERENEIQTPGIVYNYRKRWKDLEHLYPQPTKEAAFKYMFHLAIESISEDNYFSEKIIDAFACRTVPLYFGDSQIGKTFNLDGMIILDTSDFINQINALTPDDYKKRREAVEDNFGRSMKFWSFDLYLANCIINGFKK